MPKKDPEKVILVHFGELWLRGNNRGSYIKKLRSNLLQLLGGEKFSLEHSYDRFIIRVDKKGNEKRICEKLAHLFGISNYEVAYVTKPDLKSIETLAAHVIKGIGAKRKDKVKINAHRSYKELKFDSQDVIRGVIKVVVKLGMEPELQGYSKEIFINVTKDAAYISAGKVKCSGGLPVGTSGKGVVLISGGIDSPVAAWYAMKRGIEPIYVHIHGFPDAEQAIKSKIPRIIRILSQYGPGPKVYYVPSHLFQMGAIKSGRYELILLKSFMLRVAELVAEKEGAEAIFTGESLGQVASQTTSNMLAEQYGLKMQVLKPLVGFDKTEIIKVAMAIGTYDESIKPYKDVCSINAKNPATQTKLELMERLIREAKVEDVAKRSLKDAKITGAQG